MESVLQLGRYLLVVNPIIGTKWLTKVLMDGGNGLNIMYPKMLNAMASTERASGQPEMETLTFEVVRFHGTYHAILGRPFYVKFMAVPNYTYLKLKILGPSGVVIVGTSFQRAYECEVECCDHAMTIITSGELTAIRKEVTEEAPNPKKSTGSFKPAEGSKEVLIDNGSPEGKVVRIGTTLSSK
ncbi:uncharacterized protein [Miscanthus floridulus]|uniref:uncharacterized protein n=1 Tax=Miscanthus floridulus TaxID=154761 RepID=UPI003457A9C0